MEGVKQKKEEVSRKRKNGEWKEKVGGGKDNKKA